MDLDTLKFTSQEWSLLRKAFSCGTRTRPRRFTDSFIAEEKERLESYREIFREIIKAIQNKNYVPDANSDLSAMM